MFLTEKISCVKLPQKENRVLMQGRHHTCPSQQVMGDKTWEQKTKTSETVNSQDS